MTYLSGGREKENKKRDCHEDELGEKYGRPADYRLQFTVYGLRTTATHHRKKGSQQSRKTPMMMPRVRAALCSAFHPFAGRTEPPVGLDKEFRDRNERRQLAD